MANPTTIRAATEDVGLDILGIAADVAPSADTFPQRFNPAAYTLWEGLFTDPAFQAALADKRTLIDKWYLAVRVYLKLCSKEGKPAFSPSAINLNNDLVTAFLTRSRIKLAAFYKRTDFFRFGEIGRLTRTYHFDGDSMLLTVSAFFKPSSIIPGFEPFLKLMPEPRFKRDTSVPGRYTKRLAKNVNLFVRFHNRLRVEVGYSLFCERAPFAGNTALTPNKRTQTKFVELQIWIPVLRAHRIQGVGARLY